MNAAEEEEQGQHKVGDLLESLCETMGEIDELDSQTKVLKDRRRWIEGELLKQANAQGVSSFADESISVSIKEQTIASLDAEHFEDIVRWAVESENFGILQKRLGTRCALDLASNGESLPPGIDFDTIQKVSPRRKSK